LAPAAPSKAVAKRLETGRCLDEAVGGLFEGLLHAVVGSVGAGKTWLMLKAAKAPKERGRELCTSLCLAPVRGVRSSSRLTRWTWG